MAPPERKVPIDRSESSLIDSEFSSIRERFDNEMRKMEDDMNKFRSHLVDRERDFFSSSLASSHQQKTTSSKTTNDDLTCNKGELSTWLDDLKSPLVQNTEDGKILKLRFDVTQYAPEEIVVKTVDNKLQVSFVLPTFVHLCFLFFFL